MDKIDKEQLEALKYFLDFHRRDYEQATTQWKAYKNLEELYYKLISKN